MKKRILLTIAGSLAVLNLISQNYHPFPQKDAKWNVFLVFGIYDNPPDTTMLRFVLNGDTTIEGKFYNRLCLEKGDTSNPILTGYGGMREENRKVYYFGPSLIGFPGYEEVLLYDFSVKPGDTVYHNAYKYFKTVILATDSVLVGDSYRKRFKVNASNNRFPDEYWVEGIGSIRNGLLAHITALPTCCYVYWENVCFTENDTVKFKNPRFTDCYFTKFTGIEDRTEVKTRIRVYPNPATDKLTISGLTPGIPGRIQLTDISGKIIYDDLVNESTRTIDFPWESGLYIIKIKDSSNTLITRLVVKY